MTTRTFKDKHNNEWTWEETPEVVKALKDYHNFSYNYQRPFYVPHPNVKNGKNTD